jgi:hypothetical protein
MYYIQTSVYYQHRLSPSYVLINITNIQHVKLKLKLSLIPSTTKSDKEVPRTLRPGTCPLDQGYQLHVRRVRPEEEDKTVDKLTYKKSPPYPMFPLLME